MTYSATVRNLGFALLLTSLPVLGFGKDMVQRRSIPNKMIDVDGFRSDVSQALERRENRRVTEDAFLEMAKDPHTLILDARSASNYALMHIEGSRNLPFTEFTERTLATTIPSKETRILIYCNNNVSGAPVPFASKVASAALNLSTYASLHSYGYRNVYELGPVVEPGKTSIKFVRSM